MKKLNNIVVDPYLNDDMCIDRLVENWKLHKGYRYDKVITLLRECKDMGCTLILSTCCDESKFEFMENKCIEVGIHIDYINDSPPYIPFTGNKIYYNIMLDDRAGLSAAYKILYETKERIKNETF